MSTKLRLVANNDLTRFPREWRRNFAAGRRMARLMEAARQQEAGNQKEAARQFEIATRIAP